MACTAGLNDKAATKATRKDLGPGERSQAGLRLLAESELQKGKYKAGEEYIRNVGTTDFAADSRAVAATAVGAKAALFIWKLSEGVQQLPLYRVGPKPFPAGALKYQREIWLLLRKERCRWLKPKETAGVLENIEEMKERALRPPFSCKFLGGRWQRERITRRVGLEQCEKDAWSEFVIKQERKLCEENVEPWVRVLVQGIQCKKQGW